MTKEAARLEIELNKGALLLSQYNTRVWFLSLLQKEDATKKETQWGNQYCHCWSLKI